MRKKLVFLSLVIFLLLAPLGGAVAQSYSFRVDQLEVDAYWNADGTLALDYFWAFTNETYGHPIDFIDVGMPNSNFETNGVVAEVNGQPAAYVSKGEYQGNGSGFAVALGGNAIQPGQTGQVRVYVPRIENVLRNAGDNYASAVFVPTWFGSEFVNGRTDMLVAFHLPPGVGTEEPRWHAAPAGFPDEPETGLDSDGRVTYVWRNTSASASTQYKFGASFPSSYVPAGTVPQPTISEQVGIPEEDLFAFTMCCGIIGLMGFVVFASVRSAQRRKLQYLPPKIKIEGHGIKRGLTAIEAAILMEQPMDKILSMVLFSVIKKDAARVAKREPLELEANQERPEGDKGLYTYENEFLQAFEGSPKERRRRLQAMMVNLVKAVQTKMKGFSRRETLAYYKSIVEKAWGQVEAAGTPEVKSQKYDEVMEWTMLDRDYDDRTRRTFQSGPVFVPVWWGHYDPSYSSGPRPSTTTPVSTGTPGGGGGGGISMPQLPGATFAASMVNSVQNFSSNVVGNLTDFTSGVTNRTNPPPPPSTTSSRSGGSRTGGGSCACACACAGCACACAGGGR